MAHYPGRTAISGEVTWYNGVVTPFYIKAGNYLYDDRRRIVAFWYSNQQGRVFTQFLTSRANPTRETFKAIGGFLIDIGIDGAMDELEGPELIELLVARAASTVVGNLFSRLIEEAAPAEFHYVDFNTRQPMIPGVISM